MLSAEKESRVLANADPKTAISEAIEAHGGADRWNRLEALEANISAAGLLFTMKRRRRMNRVRVRASTTAPHFTFFDFPNSGQTSELVGKEEVRITNAAGEIVAKRTQPRAAFKRIRRQFYWDDLDFIYFAGYATWNYMVTPFVFLQDGFEFEGLEPLTVRGETYTRFRATFPDDIPTHSRTQDFYFDERRRLTRLDYTAEVVGGWARAAHVCRDYRDFGGILVSTRRRVTPLLFGTSLMPGPTLVAIEVHDFRPV